MIEFGPYRYDPDSRVLYRGEEEVLLAPRVLAVLESLLERAGRVVPKEELLASAWDGAFVGEDSLTQAISQLRQALGDDPKRPTYIQTVPRRGYRLVAEVSEPLRSETRIELAEVSSEEPSSADRSPAAHRMVPLVVAVLVAGLVVGWLAARWRAKSDVVPDRPDPEITPVTSSDGYERDPALSPDGRFVAFTWDGGDGGPRQLYVKDLASSVQPRQLTDVDSDHAYPAWSTDGHRIAVLRWRAGDPETEILEIPPLGGPGDERRLGTYPSTCRSRGLDWSPDDRYLAFSGCSSATELSAIFLFHMKGDRQGDRHQITFPPMGDTEGEVPWFDEGPTFSPNGSSLAFMRTAWRGGVTQIWVQPMEDDEPREAPKNVAYPDAFVWDLDWTEEGDAIVYSEGLSQANSYLRVHPLGGGEPSRLLFSDRARHLSIAAGRLVYSKWQDDVDIWRIGGPAAREAGIPTKVFSSNWNDWAPAYSPTGDRVAFVSDRRGTEEIWLTAAEGEEPQQLTELGHAQFPQWHPDGDRIAFSSASTARVGVSDVYLVDVMDVPGAFPSNVTEDEFQDSNPAWSSDGKWVYFQSLRAGGDPYEIWRMPSDGGPATRITEGGDLRPRPYRERVYFWRNGHVWSAAAEGGDEKMVLDTPIGSTSWDLWDGKLVYMYAAGPRTASIRIFDLATNEPPREHTTIEIFRPESIYSVLTVSPDGRFILYSGMDTAGSDLVLVEDFR